MVKKKCLLSVLLCFCSIVSGQNLVKNPSFEEYYHLPDTTYSAWGYYQDSAFIAKYWYKLDGLLPSYFHINSKDMRFSIPYNVCGYYPVLEGSAYVGANVLSLQDIAVPLCGDLIKPLEEGKEYEISFYYCFAHLESFFLLDKMEAFISPNKWVKDGIFESRRYTHVVEPFDTTIIYKLFEIRANVIFQDSIINDGKWHKMTGCYKAKGGEKYISLGIFYQSTEFSQAVNDYLGYEFSWGITKRNLKKFYKYYQDVLFIHRNPLYSPRLDAHTEPKEKDYYPTYQSAYYFFDNVSVVETP